MLDGTQVLKLLAAAALISGASVQADAFILTCKRSSGDIDNPSLTTVILNEAAGTLVEQGFTSETPMDLMNPERPIASVANVKPTANREVLSLVDHKGTEVGSIKLAGNPIDYKVTLAYDGTASSCTVDSADQLFAKTITDPEVHKDIATWRAWVSSRPKACGAELDSRGFFMYNGKAKTALVIHGFASNPQRMDDISKILMNAGYNVLVPRLSRHFNQNLHDLDDATPEEWLKDVEEAFRIAKSFDREITVVGYSLGGLLASQLALKYADSIERMVLVAPAWRVSPTVSAGSMIGAAFNISLNKFRNLPESCTLNGAYISPYSGRRVENLQRDVETANFGEPYNDEASAFRRIDVPTLVFTTPGDEAVLSQSISDICAANRNCRHAEVPGQDHSKILNSLATPISGAKRTMEQTIVDFLKSSR